MWATLILAAVLIALIFYRAAARPPGFPPGPYSLPIIGSVLSLFPSPKEAFYKFQEKYGDICGYNTFGKWNVIINDPALMRKAFADPIFSGRIDMYLFLSRNVIIGGKEEPLGIIGTSGDVWKHQRRFTLRSLKDQGFGRNSIEPIIQSELKELGDFFASQENKKFSVGLSFNRSVVNVIWAMIMGKRFSYGDKKLEELVDKVNKMLQTFNPFNPALQFRIIKKLFPNLEIYQKVDGYMKDLLKFIEEQMAIYDEEISDTDDYTYYMGAYLKEMRECLEENRETPLNRDHLKANMVELFLAGSETTASTLWWAVYLISTNPDIQQKIHQELDQVVGDSSIPNLEHIDKLPYTTAAIYEIQRIADLIPFAIPHMTVEDATLAGYKIPKGTPVLFNLSAGLRNGNYWKYPDKFHPEHFLSAEGKPFKPDNFMPFGYGKRVCLGESLARLELFLFFTNLMHRFTWKISDDPVIWEKSTIVSRPPNFTVYVSQRNTTDFDFRQSSSS